MIEELVSVHVAHHLFRQAVEQDQVRVLLRVLILLPIIRIYARNI